MPNTPEEKKPQDAEPKGDGQEQEQEPEENAQVPDFGINTPGGGSGQG